MLAAQNNKRNQQPQREMFLAVTKTPKNQQQTTNNLRSIPF